MGFSNIISCDTINLWRVRMETQVIDRGLLPETIFSYIQTEKIKIFEENGNIVLSPVKNIQNLNELFGKYNNLSSKEFIMHKTIEKELET